MDAYTDDLGVPARSPQKLYNYYNFLHSPVSTGLIKSNFFIPFKHLISFLRVKPFLLLNIDKIFSARARSSLYRLLCRMLFLSSLAISIRPARLSQSTVIHRLSLYISREERGVFRNSTFSFACTSGFVSSSLWSVLVCLKKKNLSFSCLKFLMYAHRIKKLNQSQDRRQIWLTFV
jgi:hypothetical protein